MNTKSVEEKRLVMSSRFILMLLPLFFIATAKAQTVETSEKIKPQWLHKLPQRSNSSFIYKVVTSTATTLNQARSNNMSNLLSETGLRNGAVIVSNTDSKRSTSQVWNNGRLTEQIDYDSETTNTVRGREVNLFVENIAEYWKKDYNGNYHLTVLYAKSELNQAPLFDDVEVTTKYGAHGLWRSAIVPGWGQFHKGSYLKGGLILGGAAALAAGIIFTSNQASDYYKKIGKTHDAKQKRTYSTKRDHFITGRNICIGALSALYIYNLVDAIVAPGASRVVVRHQGNNGRSYVLAPTVLGDGTPGMVAAVNF